MELSRQQNNAMIRYITKLNFCNAELDRELYLNFECTIENYERVKRLTFNTIRDYEKARSNKL